MPGHDNQPTLDGNRIGDWMCTASGMRFYPMDPRPEEILLRDIAHALARQCRFAGHCREFYSVAEHSVRVSVEIERRRRPADDNGWQGPMFAGLLHDAAEAYLSDVPRPLKRLPLMEPYREAEKALQSMIYDTLLPAALWADRFDTVIKLADNILLATEKRDLMPEQSAPWAWLPDPRPEVIVPWSPKEAEARFLDRFGECRAATAGW